MGTRVSCRRSPPQVHVTALVERGVEIGPGTAVWDGAHLREGARIGADCIIGEKTYVGTGVCVGNRVKINAFVYLCAGVIIEDGVMLGAGTIFTNDRYPRAATPDLRDLLPSELPDHVVETLVCEGASNRRRVDHRLWAEDRALRYGRNGLGRDTRRGRLPLGRRASGSVGRLCLPLRPADSELPRWGTPVGRRGHVCDASGGTLWTA